MFALEQYCLSTKNKRGDFIQRDLYTVVGTPLSTLSYINIETNLKQVGGRSHDFVCVE